MFGSGFRGFFPGGMEEDESQSQSQGEVDNKSMYELLGLQPGASSDDVKKAFRKKAVKEHPDKGGDAEKVLMLMLMFSPPPSSRSLLRPMKS